jgi:UDP-2,3-diacylglucosamine hydrolase
MRTLIVSDVHLNVAQDGHDRMAHFAAFLRQIDPSHVERVILLGDLFDFWFEYRQVIFSGYFDVLRAFADLKDQGVEFHFVCGNHDFWAGRFLRESLGFIIHPEPTMLEFYGQRVLLAHGDGVNKKDYAYRIYKRFARWRPAVWAFGLLHPDWAMAIAQGVSRGSRHMQSTEDLSKGGEVHPVRIFAQETLAAGQADLVMCGHTHYPVIEEFPTPDGTGRYVNPGDWLWHESYVEWDETGIRLARFSFPLNND